MHSPPKKFDRKNVRRRYLVDPRESEGASPCSGKVTLQHKYSMVATMKCSMVFLSCGKHGGKNEMFHDPCSANFTLQHKHKKVATKINCFMMYLSSINVTKLLIVTSSGNQVRKRILFVKTNWSANMPASLFNYAGGRATTDFCDISSVRLRVCIMLWALFLIALICLPPK